MTSLKVFHFSVVLPSQLCVHVGAGDLCRAKLLFKWENMLKKVEESADFFLSSHRGFLVECKMKTKAIRTEHRLWGVNFSTPHY